MQLPPFCVYSNRFAYHTLHSTMTNFTHAVNQRTTSHPSPTESGMQQPSTTLTIAVVSAGVVLVLLLVIVCSSTLIVILIVMKRRRKHNKQQLHSGKTFLFSIVVDVHVHIICTCGGYSNNAVSFTKDNINIQ